MGLLVVLLAVLVMAAAAALLWSVRLPSHASAPPSRPTAYSFQHRVCGDNEYDASRPFWRIAPRLLSSDECHALMRFALEKGMTSSQVRNFEKDQTTRVSDSCWIEPKELPLVAALCSRIHKQTGIDPSQYEPIQVVRYRPGGHFQEHYDQCDSPEGWCVDDVRRHKGMRLKTFLIYLNDTFEGGETEFLSIGRRFRPPPGDALVFDNLNPAGTCVMPTTIHRGNPVASGEKWIATVWIRGASSDAPASGSLG